MLIEKDNACLIIFNLLKDFIPSLYQGQKLIDDCVWLIDFAKRLDIPVVAIEHKQLGERVHSFEQYSDYLKFHQSIYFSCCREEDFNNKLKALGKRQVILAGAEAHISILQTAHDLMDTTYQSAIITDAITSRSKEDLKAALTRFHKLNINTITKEMFFFECLRYSEFPNYIDLSMRFLDRRYIRE